MVWLPVTDMERAVAFYRDRLGLEQAQGEGDWSMLKSNGLQIGLNARESAGGDGGAVIAFEPQGGLEKAVEELRSAGVEVPGDISEHPWGRIATFKDPDGNDLQLYEPPSD
ncbi:MAG: VOC family protein [Solirubrobacteraceae bacterium]